LAVPDDGNKTRIRLGSFAKSSLEDLQNLKPLKSGWLFKKSRKKKKWNKQWFILTKDYLIWFADKVTTPESVEFKKKVGILASNIQIITSEPDKRHVIKFREHNNSRDYLFAADDEVLQMEWFLEILEAIKKRAYEVIASEGINFKGTVVSDNKGSLAQGEVRYLQLGPGDEIMMLDKNKKDSLWRYSLLNIKKFSVDADSLRLLFSGQDEVCFITSEVEGINTIITMLVDNLSKKIDVV